MKTTEQIEFNVAPRQTGKHNSRAHRRAEQVPAVVYGPKSGNVNLYTDELTVKKYSGRKFESTIFKLKSDDSKINGQAVLLKSIQIHPVTRRPVHVDFYAVDMTQAIRVKVEIRLEGKPIGLSEGGLLQAVVRELEIECLPTAIPEYVVADVSGLGVNDSLHVSDLKVGEGIKVITRADQTIATVTVMAEEAATPAAVATDAAAPAAGAAPAAAAPAAGGDKKK